MDRTHNTHHTGITNKTDGKKIFPTMSPWSVSCLHSQSLRPSVTDVHPSMTTTRIATPSLSANDRSRVPSRTDRSYLDGRHKREGVDLPALDPQPGLGHLHRVAWNCERRSLYLYARALDITHGHPSIYDPATDPCSQYIAIKDSF